MSDFDDEKRDRSRDMTGAEEHEPHRPSERRRAAARAGGEAYIRRMVEGDVLQNLVHGQLTDLDHQYIAERTTPELADQARTAIHAGHRLDPRIAGNPYAIFREQILALVEGKKARGAHHLHGRVEAAEPTIIEDAATIAQWREELRTWLEFSKDAIHDGLTDSLLSEICKDAGRLEAESQEKLTEALAEPVRDKVKDHLKHFIRDAGVKGGGAEARALASHGGEMAAMGSLVAAPVAAVLAAKEVSDGMEEAEIATVKAKTLGDFVKAVQDTTKAAFAEYVKRVIGMDDHAVSAVHRNLDLKKPLIDRASVAFWFTQLVQAKMIATGVFHGPRLFDEVQKALHPGGKGSVE
ncbi:MAG TPA: hypothetical protein VE987_05735 [Polyangiaceae bacterium]|nr:hypothetical protein [Polyangiaceae bacterium]